MTVALIADVLGNENNGTTIACMNLLRSLRENGDRVNVVCCDQDKKNEDGYYVVGVYNLGPLINKIVEKNNVSLAKADKKVIYEAIKDADIVHIMMPFSLGQRAIKIAKKLNKPVSAGFHVQAENFTSHIGMMNIGLVNLMTYKFFYNHLYRYVDSIHYPTEFIRDLFESTVKKKTNGYVISNGVNKSFVPRKTEKPNAIKNKFVILFIGRYSKEKSHSVLIKATALSKHKDKIQLILAGQGPEEERIKKLSKKKEINMPIMAFFSRTELVDVINYSDLYCHPSTIEIEAISCLEAISCGLVPLISSSPRSATKNFAFDERNLFRSNDPKDLAARIDYWIEHDEERKKMSSKYINSSLIYNHDECMKQMRRMLVETIEKNKK